MAKGERWIHKFLRIFSRVNQERIIRRLNRFGIYPRETQRKYLDFIVEISPVADNIQNSVYWWGEYDPRVREFIKAELKPDYVFFDIGAHMGLFTLVASKKVGEKGKCVAFEPSSMKKRLHRNIEINNPANVTIVEKAVCDRSGVISFFEPEDTAMNSIAADNNSNGYEVNSISLDEYWKETGTVPNFIKMDMAGNDGVC